MGTPMVSKASDPYGFVADRAVEEQRLIAQARLFDPPAEELLREAGLRPGMQVLDLGSGAGDTAILASRLVGPQGSVLGVERSPEQVALARRRVADLGLENVQFRVGDVAGLESLLAEHPCRVDAVIGRLILMWVPGRHEVLRACARLLRPGALVWFMEPELTYDYLVPAAPSWDRMRHWFLQCLDRLGAETRMGPNLYRAFLSAGLPAPEVRGRTIMAGAASAPVWFWVNVIRALLPVIEQSELATAAEVDVDSLEERLGAELRAHDAVMIVPPLIAAWTRIPD